jgi:hypothetical protein
MMEFMSILRLFLGAYVLFPLQILFWLVVLLVNSQYRRMARNEAKLFGRAKYSVRTQVLYSTLFGLGGGLLASALLVFFGISLLDIGILYVWPLAIILLLVNPRYLCFAYAGGVVATISAILRLFGSTFPVLTVGYLGDLAGIHIPGLLALIGILHLTESCLIAVSGHLFASPMYVKTDRGVVGGFSLQKFWPLPLVGLVATLVPQAAADAAAGARMPDWWPLLASTTIPGAGQVLMYVLTPIVAGLGYGDLAVSSNPREKSKRSAINLGLYSIILLGAAFLAFHYPVAIIPAALFSPIGHELLIMIGNKREFAREPLFTAPAKGVKILDIFPNSPAFAAGLEPGDVILSVNGYPFQGTLPFHSAMRIAGPTVELELEGKFATTTLEVTSATETGMILVPDRYTPVYMEMKHKHFFGFLAEKLKKMRKVRA